MARRVQTPHQLRAAAHRGAETLPSGSNHSEFHLISSAGLPFPDPPGKTCTAAGSTDPSTFRTVESLPHHGRARLSAQALPVNRTPLVKIPDGARPADHQERKSRDTPSKSGTPDIPDQQEAP